MTDTRFGAARRTGARITGWYDEAWVHRHLIGSPREGLRRGARYTLAGGPLAGEPAELRERDARLWVATTLRAGRIIVQQGDGGAPEALPEPAIHLGHYAYDARRDAVCWQELSSASTS